MRILNEIVSKFDHLCVNYGVEKIKLIGNTYMATTGISGEDELYLVKLADFAIALREKMTEINRMFNKQFVLRIGIEAGPLVAGVIGKKKFAFDIWGSTVNVASRMVGFFFLMLFDLSFLIFSFFFFLFLSGNHWSAG